MDLKDKFKILSSSAKFDVASEPSISTTLMNLEKNNTPGGIY
ncbi:MAG TPA: hypothetical protein PK894_00720 [Defluviitoga sp.]|nr:hypothetical protein [Defluviitoga sp.]HOP24188.1 hypothetical protein [Defluviitoga sp.]HPZ28220.1 hypothetical protein [Defluviitoga sp.]HQD62110.1 hypothetical protein [Defluviitoga sp.]